MYPQHINPEEAVQIHVDISSEFSFGIHWGTFKQLGCFEVNIYDCKNMFM